MTHTQQFRLVVVGGAGLDTVFRVPHVPKLGELLQIDNHTVVPGGGELTTAAYCASLGEPTLLVAGLGEDEEGLLLKRYGEQLPNLAAEWTMSNRTTGAAAVLIQAASGERTIIHAPHRDDIVGTVPASVRSRLHTAAVVWINADKPERRAEYHREVRGIRATWLPLLPEEAKLARSWEVFIGSEDEATANLENDLAACEVEICVVTDGSNGGRYWTRQEGWRTYLPQKAAATSGDSLGAGDAFRGGVLVGLVRGLSVPEAVDLGAQCGANAMAFTGGWPVGDSNA